MGKTKKILSVVFLAVALLIPVLSSGSAQAASFSSDGGLTFDLSELQNLPVQGVRTGIVAIVDNQQTIQENLIKDLKIPTKPISSGSVIVSEEQAAEKAGQISVRSTYPLNGSLAPNKYRSWTFWRNAGQTSNFSCSWSPAVTIGAGLLDGNGNWIFFNYFTGSCNMNASFAQSGNYSWALCNTSSNTITYNGSFTY